MTDFPNSNSLKALVRRDQGPKRLHIMVLSADGQTRRLTFSPIFFWILGFLFLFILAALTYLSHQFVDLTLERDALKYSLDNLSRFTEKRDYSKAVAMAPEEARRILEILDRAIVMSESDADEVGLIGVPEPNTEDVQVSPTDPKEPLTSPTDDLNATVEPPTEPKNTEEDKTIEDPLFMAWNNWHKVAGPIKTPLDMDIDDFEVSPNGQITFLLRQSGEPGVRVKGRVLVVLAIKDKKEKISLVSAPTIDMTQTEQAWELGSKYNIIASKLVRVQAQLPDGAEILNAEVTCWEDDTKELVFRKKILIESK